MKLNASDFPTLRKVFSGYLHEDYTSDYHSPREALNAFLHDASADERERFANELERFLDETAAMDFDDVQALAFRLGSRWAPPSREAMLRALEDVRGALPGKKGRTGGNA